MAPQADPLREEAYRLFSQGKRIYEVAQALNRSRSTVQGWRNLWQAKPAPAAPVDPSEALAMENAALRAKLKIAEGTRPEVVPAYIPPESMSPANRWRAAEKDNAEHIRKALMMAQFSVELPAEPIAIVAISDQHISLGNCVDLCRMREDAELVSESEGAYIVLAGDGVDNHIKHRSAALAARSQPKEQWELFEYYLQIIASKVLVAISGNHDLWTDQFAGIDVMGDLCKRNRVCYAPDEALLKVMVGRQEYPIGIRHQFRMSSTFNQTHSPKQWLRMGDDNWRIGIVGHHHVAAIEPFYHHGVERWACRPGSYQISSAYSRQFGFSKVKPTCPSFVLYPDRDEIVGFHDVRAAMRFLKAERG